MTTSDLDVELSSACLTGRQIDVIVTGSIAAVESVRFIRALRRLGATVHPWLSAGGQQFITPMALSWAAANPCETTYRGEATHIAQHDACVIAPASADFLAKIAHGIADSPETSLVLSHLGQGHPVLFLPCMHESLWRAPTTVRNLVTLKEFATELPGRVEEGKLKFPDAEILAGEIAHALNSKKHKALVTLGPTRGYIDAVRYLSNHSSGALGSHIVEELYRYGWNVTAISGPATVQPRFSSTKVDVETTEQMLEAVRNHQTGCQAGIFCASVLDYEPQQQTSGKIRSGAASLDIHLSPTPKILKSVSVPYRVAFKLEVDTADTELEKIAADYLERYDLRMLITNRLPELKQDPKRHPATVFSRSPDGALSRLSLDSKAAIAKHVVQDLEKFPG